MYGAEYEHPIGGTGTTNDDATCAVCYVSTRETELMLPAKTSCPTSGLDQRVLRLPYVRTYKG